MFVKCSICSVIVPEELIVIKKDENKTDYLCYFCLQSLDKNSNTTTS